MFLRAHTHTHTLLGISLFRSSRQLWNARKSCVFDFFSASCRSEDVQSKSGLISYLSLTWPGPARREAPGRQNSGSILPKTVPSLRCWSPSPAGLGAPAAGLEHLSSARGSLSSENASPCPPTVPSRCVCVCWRWGGWAGLVSCRESRHLTESQCGAERWRAVRSSRQSALSCARVE